MKQESKTPADVKVESISSRQASLDVVKFFAAFMVVVIHTGFSGKLGLGAVSFSRIAVPLFFMITGYYYPVMTKNGIWRHVKKIIFWTLAATLFYFLWNVIQSFTGECTGGLADKFTFKSIACWVLLNETPVSGHLWYFYALLYIFVILYITEKWHRQTWLYRLLPLLLIFNYYQSYGSLLYYRNFLFTGLPYVLLGCLFRMHGKKLLSRFPSNRNLLLGFFALCACLALELYVYGLIGVSVYRDHYLFTLPMVVCVFAWTLRNPRFGEGTYMAFVGKSYSAFIYMLHPFIIFCFSWVSSRYLDNLFLGGWSLNLRPFIVFGLTLMAVIVLKMLCMVLFAKRL